MDTVDLKKERRRYAALFIALFLLFFIARFPLKEARLWAISKAAASAELNISLGDSSLLLPLGLELENFAVAGKKRPFVTPEIERFGIRANPISLIGGRKTFSFYIVNGGEGKGTVTLEDGRAEIAIDSTNIKTGGLRLENGASIEHGKISINGKATATADYMEGKGSLQVEGSDMLLKDASPFAPLLPLKEFSAKLEKNGANLKIKSLALAVDGLLFNGQGTVTLAKPATNSTLNLSGEVNLSKSSDSSPIYGLISMIRGMTGNEDSFTVQVSGTAMRPDLRINGKKLF